MPAELTDDRQNIQPGERVLLIIEDDAKFGRILLDLAHDRGFKAVVSATGSGALPLVRRFNPALITLDINLPDMDGWRLLDILKRSPDTRHIPIHIISVEDPRERGLQMGAFSVLEKPVDHATLQQALARTEEFIARPVKELLLVEDDDLQRGEIVKVIGNGDVTVTQVRTGAEALQVLQERSFDCAVLDLVLPDMDGLQLVETIRRDSSRRLPIIIHTAKDVGSADEAKLRNLVESFILKGPESHQQLFDETALFMHRHVAGMAEDKRRIIDLARRREAGLAGRRVLIVDDDIRNIFSLTGVLEQHQVQVVNAESGRQGIEQLEAAEDIDMVLMDVMMPDMDGYETMRQIRRIDRFRKLPIIAITAKAMVGDREKCIAAGASEYISKPVDTDQLVSMMRVAGMTRARSMTALRRQPRQVSAVESKATILIVDDEPDNRFALSHVLAELEQRVVEAASGEDALRFLLREECAVILLDANMPGLDGYATAETDPPSRALAAHPDHLRQRHRQGRRAHRARLRDGRGRLRLQAGRPRDPALEDRGAGRSVSQERGSPAPGAAGAHAAGREPAHPAGEARSRAAAAADRGAPDRNRAFAADRAVQRTAEGPLLRAAFRQRRHGKRDRLSGRALRRGSGSVARAHSSRRSRARARRRR